MNPFGYLMKSREAAVKAMDAVAETATESKRSWFQNLSKETSSKLSAVTERRAAAAAREAAEEKASIGYGTSDVLKSWMDDGKAGRKMWKGGIAGGGAALLGSAVYGSTRMISPNNAEVNNPVSNMVKGAMVGVAAGAIMAATHGAGLGSIKLAGASSEFMQGVEKNAKMVNGAMQSNLFRGALGAAIIAGSGDVSFTRPINPVF